MSPRPSPLFAALALALACANKGATTTTDAAPVVQAKAPDAAAFEVASPDSSVASVPDLTWAFDCTDLGTPKRGKSVGHTSVVFKLELSNGKKAAWKPNARKVKERYRGEIAAFRLGRALGIPNVPPACPRTFDAAIARTALAPTADAAQLFADQVIVEQEQIHGVVIPWIDGLRFWPLEKEPLRTEVRSWLASGDIPPEKRLLAGDASTLAAFDFITGNWDRSSGENVGLDAAGSRLIFIDNDAAFMERPPADQLARNKALVEATARFSKGFIKAVRALDAGQLAQAIGEESAGHPLLSATVLAAVGRRMTDLLTIVDAKIAARGETATLYFP